MTLEPGGWNFLSISTHVYPTVAKLRIALLRSHASSSGRRPLIFIIQGIYFSQEQRAFILPFLQAVDLYTRIHLNTAAYIQGVQSFCFIWKQGQEKQVVFLAFFSIISQLPLLSYFINSDRIFCPVLSLPSRSLLKITCRWVQIPFALGAPSYSTLIH